jgi:signal transduction histidine kinase
MGIVGGMIRASRTIGTRVGEIARQILDGTRPADIPIDMVPLVPTFDWRQRWGIDASWLPPGSDIRFRTPTPWESYRGYIVATVIVVAAQLLLITGLLTQRARRRRAEETVLIREATLRTSYDRIRQLAGRLINAQETARAELARDLHDGVCQELAGVSMAIGRLRNTSGHVQDAATQQALVKLQNETRGMVDDVRRLSHELHPAPLRLVGLAAALKTHCSEVAKRHGVQVSFQTQGDPGAVAPDAAVSLFRIAQESLRNGIAHGGAGRLAVSLARSGDHIELTVTDDGRGFDLDTVRRDGRGLGLVSMEERAHAVGGQVQIVSGVPAGTTVRVRCPAGAAASPE